MTLNDAPRIVLCEPTELYNILQQKGTVYPCLSDPNYLLLLDARKSNEYNESHVITSKKAPRSQDGVFLVPYDAELECKLHVIVIDNNTSSLEEKGPALSCAQLLSDKGSRNPVKILRGGYERFSALYPFLRTHKIIFMPQALDHLSPYPVEVISGQLYMGTMEQASQENVMKDLKVKAIVHTDDETRFSKDSGQIDELCIPLQDDEEADIFSRLNDICDFIGNHLGASRTVLVCSDEGFSRGVTIVLAFLMQNYKWPLKAAYEHLQKCKWNIRPRRSFIHQLSQWEQQLFQETLTDISDPNY